MRRVLDFIYDACATLAGLFMIALALFVLYSLGPSIGIWLKDSFGLPNPFNYIAASADEFAGWSMATSAFLALASTFAKGEHIRVTLILQRFKGAARRRMEIWCLGAGIFLSGYFAWYTVKMCIVSYQLGDTSTGQIAVKLWIPQIGLAIGAVVFFIAMIDQFIRVARGGALVHEGDALEAHIER